MASRVARAPRDDDATIRAIWDDVYRPAIEEMAREYPERNRRVPFSKFRLAFTRSGVLKDVRRIPHLDNALSVLMRRPRPVPFKCGFCDRRHWTRRGFNLCSFRIMDAHYGPRAEAALRAKRAI